MVKIETHWIGTDGETQSVTTAELSAKAAALYAERVSSDCRDLGRREELFTLSGDSSVQCVYDEDGEVWRAVIYTETEAGYGTQMSCGHYSIHDDGYGHCLRCCSESKYPRRGTAAWLAS